MEDNALKIKVPEGILMQSEPEGDIFPCSPDNLLSVFKDSDQSDFQENKKKAGVSSTVAEKPATGQPCVTFFESHS